MITALDERTALVVIDLQNGVLAMPLAHPVAGILHNAVRLTKIFRQANLPLVLVNVNPAGAAWTRARKEHIRVPSPADESWFQLVPEIKAEPPDIFITKHTWNAFFETTLHEELQKRKVTGIVLAGISTSIGVEGTARAASELGYNITFVTDAMNDTIAAAHENSIQNIFPRIGETGTTEEVIGMLSERM